MQLFISGATGFIGSVVTEMAIAEGHAVRGLSRSEEGDAKLTALGAVPVRGDLTTLDVLSAESARADAVLQLAFIHDWSMDFKEVLRIDRLAMDALSKPLHGTGKPFVISSGTAGVEPDPAGGETTEETTASATHPLSDRKLSEEHALSMADENVRVSAIRLAPYVYGRGGGIGFVTMLMRAAAKAGESLYIGDGQLRTSTVHVDDAAALYLLAAKGGKAGEKYNCTGSTTVKAREIAEAIGAVMELPVRSVTPDEASEKFGPFLTWIIQIENRASSRKAIQELGWQPKGIDLITDIRTGSYRTLAESLKQG